MPQPTSGDVHVNAPLTNISVAYLQSLDGFIADKAFPMVPVQKKSDTYFTYPKQQWFRTDAKERAPSSESAGSGYEQSTATYSCIRYGLHKDIDDEIRANTDTPLDADRDGTEFVSRGLVLKREKLWASKYFITSLWTGSTTGGDITPTNKWDVAAGTPIEDIRAQMESMETKTGFRPNKLILPSIVWNALQDSADFIDRMSVHTTRIMTTQILAAILEIDAVLVARATNDTAIEGATASMSRVIGTDNALLVYAPPRPGLLIPSAGYTFTWTGYLGAGAQGQRIKKFRMDPINSDRIEGEMAFDQKVVAADLGVFFLDVLS
jgi:hypothetical protein